MGITINRLKVEGKKNPLGLGTDQPRFSWILGSDEPSQMQTAYHIQVATMKDKLEADIPDIWDSGIVESDQSVFVPYSGSKLSSQKLYHWRVRVKDKDGRFSDWSEPSWWGMGILHRNEWQGKWIGREIDQEEVLPSPTYLRKEFQLGDRPIRRAVVYATALGLYELWLNGERVGDDRFAPGWTDYGTRVQYQAYDVTKQLKQGANAVGGILGTGWYAGHVGMMGRHIYGTTPRMLMQMKVEYEDGTDTVIVTDDTWRTTVGPIVYSDIIKGEKYDARLEMPGWTRPGYADEAWSAAVAFPPYNGELTAQDDEPIRVVESLKPVKMWQTKRGTYIYDLGQNMAGWVRITVKGEAGREIMMEHAEMLNDDDTLYTENLRKAVQKDIYIKRSDEEETYEPHFTFHGFRYVEVEGAVDLNENSLVGQAAYSAAEVAGSFESSDSRVNQLYSNICWGQKGNFFSVPTDCPQRDERLGWTGDAQVFARTAAYNMNVSNFFRKYMIDVTDAQRDDGAFPDTAPDAGWYEFKQVSRAQWFAPDNAGWGDAGVIIPWTMYLMYGDRRILETHYEAMKNWIDYLQRNSDGLIRPDYANHADWLSINADTPKDVLATEYFAYSTDLFSRIAQVLGKTKDAETYRSLFERINHAFIERYVAEDGKIEGDTQTVYVLALAFRMLPEPLEEKAVARLVKLIEENGGHLSTGFLGVSYLLPVLSQHGQDELAYSLLLRDSFPSWLYSVKHGATTIWERWDGWTEENGFQSPSMNSFNHYSLGSVGEWMYRYAVGIEPDQASPGFRHIRIEPRPDGRFEYIQGSFESEYGTIRSHWRIDAERNQLILNVEVPVNTTATVLLPGEAAMLAGDADACGLERGRSKYEIGSGTYTFISSYDLSLHRA